MVSPIKKKLGVSAFEMKFMKRISWEDVESHGNDDIVLYIPDAQENEIIHDPLYNEPIGQNDEYFYKAYPTKGFYYDFSTSEEYSEGGEQTQWTKQLEITLLHLEEAGVPTDVYSGDKAFTGCKAAIFIVNKYEFFDVVQTEAGGAVNRSGLFTQYILDLKQDSKFNPERKVTNLI